MVPPKLDDIVCNLLDPKARWLTHAKTNLTRKMSEELALAEKTKPSGQSGAELQVQNITFNSNYNLLLNKVPPFLHTFESVSDNMLTFLSGIQSDEQTSQNKLKAYKECMVSEETAYKA